MLIARSVRFRNLLKGVQHECVPQTPRFIVNFSSLLAGAAPASRPIAVAVSTRAADAVSADETRRKIRRRRGRDAKKNASKDKRDGVPYDWLAGQQPLGPRARRGMRWAIVVCAYFRAQGSDRTRSIQFEKINEVTDVSKDHRLYGSNRHHSIEHL